MEYNYFRNIRKNYKSNSTTTILVKHFINNPNIISVIRSISHLIIDQIYEDNNKPISPDLNMFSDDFYINRNKEQFDNEILSIMQKYPGIEEVTFFIEDFINSLKSSAECIIIAYIYLNRFIANSSLPLTQNTYRPLFFISLILAHKFWNSCSETNEEGENSHDFVEYYPLLDPEDLNILINKFLFIINNNVEIKFSIFSQYYFELKELSPDSLLSCPMQVQFNDLEIKSKASCNNLNYNGRTM